MHSRSFFVRTVCTLALLASTPALAAEEASPYLTGDWGGARTELEDRGVTLGAEYLVDIQSNVSGGIRRGTDYLDNLELSAELDGEKLYGIKGSTIFISALR